MIWKEHVNKTLTRTTGYMLTRTKDQPTQRLEKRVDERLERLERLVKEQTKATKAAQAALAAELKKTAAPKPPEFPGDFDEDYREVIRAVRPYTMTGNGKLHALITATRYVHRFQVPGSVVECGVWRGGSMHAVARTLTALGAQDRDLYLYDTFEGMTEPGDKDRRHDGKPAAQILDGTDKTARVWAVASLEDVQAGFATVPYPSERVHYVKGPIEQTIPAQMPDQIAILRLDTDWYESTAHEFEHLYPRLVSGGVLMIDDYGFWKGSREATDEFMERTGERLLLVRMDSGRVAVKP